MQTLPDTLNLPPCTRLRQGSVLELAKQGALFGARGLLVHGRSLEQNGMCRRITDAAPATVRLATWMHPGGEPTLDHLESLLEAARSVRVDWIAAVGGGSVMDVAKAAAGLYHATRPVREYHDGAEVEPSRIPFLAAPTTAGTGSEATAVCVLTNTATGVKKSFRHASFMARLVILDPDLLTGCPREVTAASGMDAFTQAVESFVSNRSTWITEVLSLRAITLIAHSLDAVFNGARDRQSDLLVGSYVAGIALSNARLGLVHGLAHPLGARYHAAHGLACAACLAPVLEFNRAAIGGKYDEMSRAAGVDLADLIKRWWTAFGLESPFAGRPMADREGIIRETMESGSTAANPRPVTPADVERLLDVLVRGGHG
jgi:alcohol dehydrogenase class IV